VSPTYFLLSLVEIAGEGDMFSFRMQKPQIRVEVLFFGSTGDFDDVPSLKKKNKRDTIFLLYCMPYI